MGRRPKIPLTPEQISWRDNLVNGRIGRIKNAEIRPVQVEQPNLEIEPDPKIEDEIGNCFYYMNNCVYWMNQYIEGTETKERLLQTARSIQINGKKIEQLLQKLL